MPAVHNLCSTTTTTIISKFLVSDSTWGLVVDPQFGVKSSYMCMHYINRCVSWTTPSCGRLLQLWRTKHSRNFRACLARIGKAYWNQLIIQWGGQWPANQTKTCRDRMDNFFILCRLLRGENEGVVGLRFMAHVYGISKATVPNHIRRVLFIQSPAWRWVCVSWLAVWSGSVQPRRMVVWYPKGCFVRGHNTYQNNPTSQSP